MSRIAVLGGGLAGCCVAIALAERGRSVTIYDRGDDLLTGASFANEGKIHLGYVYAGDRSLATARRMIQGALTFEPLMRRYLAAAPDVALSSPFLYGVERTSQIDADAFERHLGAVHGCIEEAATVHGAAYFGAPVCARPRRQTSAELERSFDPARVEAAFATPEVAVEPETLARQVRERIAGEPRISLRLGHVILGVEDAAAGLVVVGRDADRPFREVHSDVVNALWDGRIAVDATRGLRPERQWFHRLKYGVRFDLPPGARLPSATLVLGPYGDSVAYADGTAYLSWYPAGMVAHSMEFSPPFWPRTPDPALDERIARQSLLGLAEIVPAVRALDATTLAGLRVKGGIIVAWGKTDIDDRRSGLHERRDIGVVSDRRYHSIDTGKLTMAPYFASVCAARVLND